MKIKLILSLLVFCTWSFTSYGENNHFTTEANFLGTGCSGKMADRTEIHPDQGSAEIKIIFPANEARLPKDDFNNDNTEIEFSNSDPRISYKYCIVSVTITAEQDYIINSADVFGQFKGDVVLVNDTEAKTHLRIFKTNNKNPVGIPTFDGNAAWSSDENNIPFFKIKKEEAFVFAEPKQEVTFHFFLSSLVKATGENPEGYLSYAGGGLKSNINLNISSL